MRTAILTTQPTATLRVWAAICLSVVALVIPVSVLHHSGDAGFRPVAFLLTGGAFADRPLVTGGALDQPSLHKELFILGYSLIVLCPFLALVRWINGPSSRQCRSLFAVLSLVLLAHPLSVLTIFTYDVFRYVLVMGVTPKRLSGLVLAGVVFLVVLRFAGWIHALRRDHDPCPKLQNHGQRKH